MSSPSSIIVVFSYKIVVFSYKMAILGEIYHDIYQF